MNKVKTNDALKGLTTAYKRLEKSAGARGEVKVAVLLASGAKSLERARTVLANAKGNLRRALQQIGRRPGKGA